MAFKNFSIWRGRLPHWRASDVTYFVTFRYRRVLEESERRVLIQQLTKPDGKRWDLLIVAVLPERTDLIFRVKPSPKGGDYELSEIVEKAKAKASKLIMKKSGEKFSPFYNESYDRIIRDESELEERWQSVFDSPIDLELVEDPEEYDCLWVADAPQ
jgi:hypothetical protein